jgi:hypothetical protein
MNKNYQSLKRISLIVLILPILSLWSCAQKETQTISVSERWQQRVEYDMDVDMDVNSHRYTGKQKITYYNNSSDTLYRVFYHLYFNAFQPNSAMDVRSRTIADPDNRVKDRIFYLNDDEIGYLRVNNLKMNGMPADSKEVGTILEVDLPKPILPNTKVEFELDFEGQVPVQIRRSGRYSSEGIAYSMAQWYPKMAEYDYQGWHANPYIGREFYGVWGDFNVKISIDSSFVVGGTGYLQNPLEIGHGYEEEGQSVNRPNSEKLTWHFHAPQVHDFMWAADPNYTHTKLKMEDGVVLHFFYVENEGNTEAWKQLPELTKKGMEYINTHFGKYPYKQFSVIMGGDGGMEYPMSTLITGNRNLQSLVGVTMHEMLHSWYHGVLGSNESLYPWMDEGFTSYASNRVMSHLFGTNRDNPQRGSYGGYYRLALSGLEEPMSTHADHYHTNMAYGSAAYNKGAVFMAQLGYVIGEKNLAKGLLRYWDEWQFKHPNPNDLIRVMEKTSGLELDWYKEYMVYTTKTIDYAVSAVEQKGDGNTSITLARLGQFPMPIDLEVTYTNGKVEIYSIPLQIMRGHKPADADGVNWIKADSWSWTHPSYELNINVGKAEIAKIVIDPSLRLADLNRENNTWTP